MREVLQWNQSFHITPGCCEARTSKPPSDWRAWTSIKIWKIHRVSVDFSRFSLIQVQNKNIPALGFETLIDRCYAFIFRDQKHQQVLQLHFLNSTLKHLPWSRLTDRSPMPVSVVGRRHPTRRPRFRPPTTIQMVWLHPPKPYSGFT